MTIPGVLTELYVTELKDALITVDGGERHLAVKPWAGEPGTLQNSRNLKDFPIGNNLHSY